MYFALFDKTKIITAPANTIKLTQSVSLQIKYRKSDFDQKSFNYWLLGLFSQSDTDKMSAEVAKAKSDGGDGGEVPGSLGDTLLPAGWGTFCCPGPQDELVVCSNPPSSPSPPAEQQQEGNQQAYFCFYLHTIFFLSLTYWVQSLVWSHHCQTGLHLKTDTQTVFKLTTWGKSLNLNSIRVCMMCTWFDVF